MIASAIVILLIICILYAPVETEASFKGKDAFVRIKLWGIPVLKLNPRKKKKAESEKKSPEEKAKSFEKKTKSLGERLSSFAKMCTLAVKLLRKYARIKNISVSIRVGTGDAAITAVSAGALWAAVYALLGIVGSIIYIDKHSVDIAPDYGEAHFSAEGKCIIKSRIAYIIIIAITILVRKGKEE